MIYQRPCGWWVILHKSVIMPIAKAITRVSGVSTMVYQTIDAFSHGSWWLSDTRPSVTQKIYQWVEQRNIAVAEGSHRGTNDPVSMAKDQTSVSKAVRTWLESSMGRSATMAVEQAKQAAAEIERIQMRILVCQASVQKNVVLRWKHTVSGQLNWLCETSFNFSLQARWQAARAAE